MTKSNYLLIFFFLLMNLLIFVGCAGKKQVDLFAPDGVVDTLARADSINIRPADIHVPFYTEIAKYDNNLSSIASGVRFVKLDDEPLFRDFLIHDVQQCDSFVSCFCWAASIFSCMILPVNFFVRLGAKDKAPESM